MHWKWCSSNPEQLTSFRKQIKRLLWADTITAAFLCSQIQLGMFSICILPILIVHDAFGNILVLFLNNGISHKSPSHILQTVNSCQNWRLKSFNPGDSTIGKLTAQKSWEHRRIKLDLLLPKILNFPKSSIKYFSMSQSAHPKTETRSSEFQPKAFPVTSGRKAQF